MNNDVPDVGAGAGAGATATDRERWGCGGRRDRRARSCEAPVRPDARLVRFHVRCAVGATDGRARANLVAHDRRHFVARCFVGNEPHVQLIALGARSNVLGFGADAPDPLPELGRARRGRGRRGDVAAACALLLIFAFRQQERQEEKDHTNDARSAEGT